MKVIWYGSLEDKNWLAPERTVIVAGIDDPQLPPNFDIAVIDASFGVEAHRARQGLRWLQRLRRETMSIAPALVYSFEKREDLVSEYSMLAEGMPGIGFVRLPGEPGQFDQELSKLTPLSEPQLQEIIRWHCGLQEDWEKLAHDLPYTLVKYPARRDEARKILEPWAETVSRFAPKQKIHFDVLQNLLALEPANVSQEQIDLAFRKLRNGLSIGLNTQPLQHLDLDSVADSFPRRPPKNYSRVLVANDTPDLPLVALLREQFGYEVLAQALTLGTAKQQLNANRPSVVIADYHFPKPRHGVELIRIAKKASWNPIVIANSYKSLPDDELLRGVFNRSGDDAHNPKLIHALIWTASGEKGQTDTLPNQPLGSVEIEEDSLRSLTSCLESLDFYCLRWSKFRDEVVRFAPRAMRHRLSMSQNSDEFDLIKEFIEVFEPYETEISFSFQVIGSLIQLVGILHHKLDKLPDSSVLPELKGICHDVERFSLEGVNDVTSRLQKTIKQLHLVPVRAKLSKDIQRKLDDCARDFSLSQAKRLGESVRKALVELGSGPTGKALRRKIQPKKRFNFLIVEDDEDWCKHYVLPVVESIREDFEAVGYQIEYETYNNKEAALRAAPALDKARKIAPKQGKPDNTIAVVDLYLPKDEAEASQIKAARAKAKPLPIFIPRKENGKALVKELRARGIAVIVLSSSAPNDARIDLQRLGVASNDYILKNYMKPDRLRAALMRNLDDRTRHTIENLGDNTRTQFLVDDFEIPLSRIESRTLRTICELYVSEGACTILDILDRQNKEVNTTSVATEQKLISSIRRKIQKILALHGKQVGREDIIASHYYPGDTKARYGLAPTVDFIHGTEDEDDLPCRILVVEDDPDTKNFIANKLKTELKNVEIELAANLEEALAVARVFSPEILSLDLKLPRTAVDTIGDLESGLAALAEIRLFRNAVRVVVPTNEYRNKALLDRAAELGISNIDIIPKSAANWEGRLVDIVEYHQRELRDGRKPRDATMFVKPVVEILPETDFASGQLHLSIDGFPYDNLRAKHQKPGMKPDTVVPRIIGRLLTEPGRLVTWEEIGNWIGRELSNDPDEHDDDKKNWTKRCRNVIKKWLKDRVPKTNVNAIVKLILERPKTRAGLILNVRVVGNK